MRDLFDVALGFIERSEHRDTLKALVLDFSETLRHFGFDYWMMTRLPALNEDAEPYVIAHTWPEQWLRQYREQRYFWHDPVSLFSFSKFRPFTWGEAKRGSQRTRISMRLFSEAKSLGLADGIGFPLCDPSSAQAVVSLAADRPVDLSLMDRQMLHLVCINAELRAAELFDMSRARIARISDREKEVLRWIANGKSAADVGDILGLSERVVKEHLSHSRTKLNATTTTHAVAKALKSRQLNL